jgi:hypothetical protein
MTVEMAIWKLVDGRPEVVPSSQLRLESQLEDLIVEDPTILGMDLLLVGRQVTTPHRGFLDLLAVDADGRLHVLELKRDRTPRDVVAQTLDYGSWVKTLSLAEVTEIFAQGGHGSFEDAFAERFDSPLPDVFNADQQFTVVASELDPTSDRIVEFLAEDYGVPINAVFFRYFEDGENHYLARTWLLSPEEVATATNRGSRPSRVRPWNGQDHYVIQGNTDTGTGRWEFARQFGYLTAGGGSWYWKPLRNLRPGQRVFAYVGGAGYVGLGEITGEVRPLADVTVTVDGHTIAAGECSVLPERMRERTRTDDPEETEYAVPVRWLEARTVDQAFMQSGLFASQVTVCKLRDERTIAAVNEAFGSPPTT